MPCQPIREFLAHSAKSVSDAEAALTLKEYFSGFGAVSEASRFFLHVKPGKRCFLIQFRQDADAAKAANRCRLRSFAYNGVLVELDS